MSQQVVQVTITFEALLEAVEHLDFDEKRRLWELLEQQVAQAEEELWEQDPALQAEIQQARSAWEAGDYLTLDEYRDQHRE